MFRKILLRRVVHFSCNEFYVYVNRFTFIKWRTGICVHDSFQ
jgi:hypothetical protein